MGGNAAKERRRLKRLEQDKQIKDKEEAQPSSKNDNPVLAKKAVPKQMLAPKENSKPKPIGFKKSSLSKSKDKVPFAKKGNALKSKSKFQLDKRGDGSKTGGTGPKRAGDKPKGVRDKMRKPKHLARKINDASDPKDMEELMKKQEELLGKKTERAKRFKERVIKAVGGLEYFNEEMYNSLMENGGGKMESIIDAVKIKNDVEPPVVLPSAPKKSTAMKTEENAGSENNDILSTQKDKREKSVMEAVTTKNDDKPPVLVPSLSKESTAMQTEENDGSENNNILSNQKDEIMENAGGKIKSIIRGKEITNDAKPLAVESSASKESISMKTEENAGSEHNDTFSNQVDRNEPTREGSPNKELINESKKVRNYNPLSATSNSSSSGSENSDSDDSDSDDSEKNVRTRGRRRKDRKEADAKRDELNAKQQEEAEIAKAKEQESAAKKTSRADDKRRCIGRKPITDFKVGSKYTGTVRYVKPGLGLFIDIGCHSDAFCHISRAADDFTDNIADLYKTGDELENKVRIVEVNRTKKRITVSLQSDERTADEEKSARDHKERVEEKVIKKRKIQRFGTPGVPRTDFNVAPPVKSEGIRSNESTVSQQEETKDHVREEVPIIIDPENMTPAELKRARKLQRRAERRKEQELTGIAA
jgi:predicted RNA-binding protein with RPS1 domain